MANANRIPAGTCQPRTKEKTHPAISAATSRLNCCSLIPCTTGNVPNTSSTTTVGSTQDSRKPITPSHTMTLSAVNPASSQRNRTCTSEKGSLTLGASKNATYTGYANAC